MTEQDNHLADDEVDAAAKKNDPASRPSVGARAVADPERIDTIVAYVQVGKPLTMDEAPLWFSIKRRKFEGVLAALEVAHPQVEFYKVAGRRKLFGPRHLKEIFERLPPCRSRSTNEKAPRTGTSEALSVGGLSINLRKPRTRSRA